MYLAFSSLVRFWQVLIGTDSITNLHKLEQVSSDEGIGTLAENLLEALREHPAVNKKIDAARRETRAEKKRMAMAMRQKALGTLGMTVQPPGRPADGLWHSRALTGQGLGSGMGRCRLGTLGMTVQPPGPCPALLTGRGGTAARLEARGWGRAWGDAGWAGLQGTLPGAASET